MNNLKAMGIGAVAYFAHLENTRVICNIPTLFGGDRLYPDYPLMTLLMVPAGLVAVVWFACVCGRPTRLQTLLLIPGLFAWPAIIAFANSSGFDAGSTSLPAQNVTHTLFRMAAYNILPSFAGVLIGIGVLRLAKARAQAGVRVPAGWRKLAAVAVGLLSFYLFLAGLVLVFMASAFFVGSFIAYSSSVIGMVPSAVMGCITFVLAGVALAAGNRAWKFFLNRFGMPSLLETLLLSPGLYTLPNFLFVSLRGHPKHHQTLMVTGVVFYLFLLVGSFSAIQSEKEKIRQNAAAANPSAPVNPSSTEGNLAVDAN